MRNILSAVDLVVSSLPFEVGDGGLEAVSIERGMSDALILCRQTNQIMPGEGD